MHIRLELYEDGRLGSVARLTTEILPELGKEIVVDFNDPNITQDLYAWKKGAAGVWFCDVHELFPLKETADGPGYLVRYHVFDEVPLGA